MFRFDRDANALAAGLFERAVAGDRDFGRAHAGLSFTHFQNAFLNYTADSEGAKALARSHAERAVEIDALDPFANFTLGRSLWLEGEVESSLPWLERAIALSPNYAQGIYARAWAETVLCRGEQGQAHADAAMLLSPIDPLYYAMLGARALSHLVRGDDAEAAAWGEKAAASPGAHVLIAIIAVACHALHGDMAKARIWADNARRRKPEIGRADFFRSFPFKDEAIRLRISEGLSRSGL
jgi:tetratricopeptide (TPR) repeat protein